MTVTIAVDSLFERLTGKTLSVQSVLSSKIKDTVVDITYGASDTYTTNGLVVDLSLGGRISQILDCVPISNNKGLHLEYVPTADRDAKLGKIKCYGVDPASAGGAVVGFSELPSSSSQVNSLSIKVRVRGV